MNIYTFSKRTLPHGVQFVNIQYISHTWKQADKLQIVTPNMFLSTCLNIPTFK